MARPFRVRGLDDSSRLRGSVTSRLRAVVVVPDLPRPWHVTLSDRLKNKILASERLVNSTVLEERATAAVVLAESLSSRGDADEVLAADVETEERT